MCLSLYHDKELNMFKFLFCSVENVPELIDELIFNFNKT